MAQPFALRAPLVDGHGNFGSLDGDAAAAYRYTEARLRPLAIELLSEIRKQTVDWRPNFDGVHCEPIVLPARFPNLLVNGATGIAVGMATSIPPHNPVEVLDAAIAAIDDPDADPLPDDQGARLPDGRASSSRRKRELRAIYESGQGTLKLRGDYVVEEGRARRADDRRHVDPYGQEKASLVARIADVIIEPEARGPRRRPRRVDGRRPDRPRDQARRRPGARHDVPLPAHAAGDDGAGQPDLPRSDGEPGGGRAAAAFASKAILRHFLDFRFETVRRRFEFDLEELRRRIHLLEGFVVIYDALDEAIRIIRKSDGKADAAAKLMKRFGLDDEQADAVLETKLYKLARLEIDAIRAGAGAKRGPSRPGSRRS